MRPRRSGPKTARTSSGRPMPMLSVTSASKNPLARRGSSKTTVRRHLDLAHGKLPEVASLFVLSGERRRDDRSPAVEKALYVSGAEAVADGLEGGRVSTGGKAVGELAESEALRAGPGAWPTRGRSATPWPGRGSRCRS